MVMIVFCESVGVGGVQVIVASDGVHVVVFGAGTSGGSFQVAVVSDGIQVVVVVLLA